MIVMAIITKTKARQRLVVHLFCNIHSVCAVSFILTLLSTAVNKIPQQTSNINM